MRAGAKHLQMTDGEPLTSARRASRIMLTVGPTALWLGLFLLGPLLILCAVAFLTRGSYGELQLPVTFENFKRLLGFGLLGFDPVYPAILLRSLVLAGATAVGCLAAGLPLAFFIARLPKRKQTAALILVVIPFWTNLLIRTYAWQILLSPDTILARAFHFLGLGSADQGFYPGNIAVLIGLVCDFLPFLVLPLYASVEKIDWTLAEAAADLGAGHPQVFRHAIWPQIKPGLRAGLILVLLPALGQFVVPDLLGGAKTVLLGNLIQQQFSSARDWPFGAAVGVSALMLVGLGLWFVNRGYVRKTQTGSGLDLIGGH